MLVVKILQRGCLNDPYLNNENGGRAQKLFCRSYCTFCNCLMSGCDPLLELWVVSLSFKLYTFRRFWLVLISAFSEPIITSCPAIWDFMPYLLFVFHFLYFLWALLENTVQIGLHTWLHNAMEGYGLGEFQEVICWGWDVFAVLSSDYFGSPRRCGGQGDVLSGRCKVTHNCVYLYF